jgi:hypothetical protein
MLQRLLYAALCVLLPLLWGIAVARLFEWIEQRRPQGTPRAEDGSQIEYYI